MLQQELDDVQSPPGVRVSNGPSGRCGRRLGEKRHVHDDVDEVGVTAAAGRLLSDVGSPLWCWCVRRYLPSICLLAHFNNWTTLLQSGNR